MVVTKRSFCRVCIAGCGTLVTVDGDRVLEVRGDPDHHLSQGYLCPKGRALADLHHDPERLSGALIRRGGELVPVDHAEAIDDAADVLTRVIADHGPGSIGFFMGGGGFIDPAVTLAARKLRQALGSDQNYTTATVDAIAKVVVTAMMAGTTALVPHLGEEVELTVFIGSNPIVSHGQSTAFPNPIERLRALRSRGEIVVVDPRRTETALQADHHLAARAGTDYALLAHLVRDVVARRGLDAADFEGRVVGFDELAAAVAPFDAEHAASITGLTPADHEALAEAVHRRGRLAVVTGTGTSMSVNGNLTEWLAWSLMILTDSFEHPAGMWFNPGYLTRLDERAVLPATPPTLPRSPAMPSVINTSGEWPASLMAQEIRDGRLKALIVLGCNLVTSLPATDDLEAALGELDALIVLDLFLNETGVHATHVFACPDQLERPDLPGLDLYIPARSTHYAPAVVPPAPGRPEAWWTVSEIARRLGHDLLGDPDELTTEMLLDRVARGVALSDLAADGGGPTVGEPAVYGWAEGRLPNGHWDVAPVPLVAQLAATAPPGDGLVLTPRRQLRRENGRAYREGEVMDAWMHPDDAAARGIVDGQTVDVRSLAGALRVPVRVTDRVRPGALSLPHGYGDRNVNHLISASDLDALSGMPRMSGTVVEVTAPAPVG